jgi:hypothetical protein
VIDTQALPSRDLPAARPCCAHASRRCANGKDTGQNQQPPSNTGAAAAAASFVNFSLSSSMDDDAGNMFFMATPVALMEERACNPWPLARNAVDLSRKLICGRVRGHSGEEPLCLSVVLFLNF